MEEFKYSFPPKTFGKLFCFKPRLPVPPFPLISGRTWRGAVSRLPAVLVLSGTAGLQLRRHRSWAAAARRAPSSRSLAAAPTEPWPEGAASLGCPGTQEGLWDSTRSLLLPTIGGCCLHSPRLSKKGLSAAPQLHFLLVLPWTALLTAHTCTRDALGQKSCSYMQFQLPALCL